MRLRAGLEHGLFDYQYVVMLDGPTEEMLRPLPDEIPAKVGETDEERFF
jgi:hypothetical protein